MSTVNIVSYCEQSLDPETMHNLILADKGVGLSDPQLENNLSNGNYRDVLHAVWCERDRQRRLTWLRSKQEELHPVLMFEQAIAEFSQSPNVETITSISFPLIASASFRVQQDAKCCKDASVAEGDAAVRMQMTYNERLRRLVNKHLNISMENIWENNEVAVRGVREKVVQTAQQSLTRELPAPDWVGWHGIRVFSQGCPSMYPANTYKAIRDNFANEAISKYRRS